MPFTSARLLLARFPLPIGSILYPAAWSRRILYGSPERDAHPGGLDGMGAVGASV